MADHPLNNTSGDANGIYVHIPFCIAKCAYCDFSSAPARNSDEISDYFKALDLEIEKRVSGECVSVYFGGGTPSLVDAEKITHCLEHISRKANLSPNVEITIEANPATVDGNKLEQYLAAGVNRISLGVQSMEDKALQQLGRVHRASQAEEAFRDARQAGFDNISCDLIYGLPDQSLAAFQQDLATLVAWQPEHLSLYALSIEENTPLFSEISQGCVSKPDDDKVADMFMEAMRFLNENGYFQYELSNFAKKERFCRHNLGYWQDRPYIGLGASAHSFLNGSRSWNAFSTHDYINRMMIRENAEAGSEKLGGRQRMAESMMLRLRLAEGFKKEYYQKKSPDWQREFMPIFEKLEEQGLVVCTQEDVFLTNKGKLLSNIVFRELF